MNKHIEDYMGTPIELNDKGQFVANVAGTLRRRASLSALKKLIAKSKNAVEVISVHSWGTSPSTRIIKVADLAWGKYGPGPQEVIRDDGVKLKRYEAGRIVPRDAEIEENIEILRAGFIRARDTYCSYLSNLKEITKEEFEALKEKANDNNKTNDTSST